MQVEHKPGSGMIVELENNSVAVADELGGLIYCDPGSREVRVVLSVGELVSAQAVIKSATAVLICLPREGLQLPVHIHNFEIRGETPQVVHDFFGEGDIIIRLLADEVE